MLKRFLLGTTALVMLAGPAAAEPVSLTILGVNALLGTTLTASTAIISTAAGATILSLGTVISGVFAVGLSIAGSVLASGRRKGAIDPGAAKSTFETGNSGRIRTIGRVRIGGLKVYGNTVGTDRYRVIAHSAGPIDGIEEHFLGGRSVVVDPDGVVSSPPFIKAGGSYVTILSKIGDGTETAWTQLTTAFPSLWTADHRVRGIAQSLIKYVSPGLTSTKFAKLYQSGAPDYERIQRGELLYDPRDGVTRWSDNGVLGCLHVALTFPDFELADFDLPFIAEQADLADEPVATRTGTEPRSRVWGVWDEDGIERGDLLKQVLDSAGCEIISRPNQKLGIRLVDDFRPSEVHIRSKHITEFSLKFGPDGVDRPNICRVKYYSPERNYELSEIPLVIDATIPAPVPLSWSINQSEIDRVGEKPLDISLPFCPSAAQACRITRRMFSMARGDTGTLQTNMTGLACWGAKTISIDPPDIDGPLVLEIDPPSVDDESGTVSIPFIVQPSLSAWVPATDEALAPAAVPELEFETTLATPATATENAVVTYPASGGTATRFGFSDAGAGMTVEANYRVVTAGVPGSWQSMTEYRANGGRSHAYVAADLSGQAIDFRLRYFNPAEDGSKWSSTYSVTPAVNNAAPTAPSVSIVAVPDTYNYIITVTAPASLQVSYIVMSGTLCPASTTAVKPGEVFEITVVNLSPLSAGTYTATATPYASNGTAGTATTASVTV